MLKTWGLLSVTLVTHQWYCVPISPFFSCSYKPTWTRSTRTNFGGYLWRSRSLFRTAARPSQVRIACTGSFRLPRRRRGSTTRRHSQRTKRRRAPQKGSTTRPSRSSRWDSDWWMCSRPQIYDETAPALVPVLTSGRISWILSQDWWVEGWNAASYENLFDRSPNFFFFGVFYVVCPFGSGHGGGGVAVCRSTLLELLHRECIFFSRLSIVITLRIVVLSETGRAKGSNSLGHWSGVVSHWEGTSAYLASWHLCKN